MNERVFKLLVTAATVGAAAMAKQVADKGWRLVMASDPPTNPEDPDTDMWEAVAWALASGAIVALARLFATRKMTQYYTASTGEKPANPNQVTG